MKTAEEYAEMAEAEVHYADSCPAENAPIAIAAGNIFATLAVAAALKAAHASTGVSVIFEARPASEVGGAQ